jgi:hypothetical protein
MLREAAKVRGEKSTESFCLRMRMGMMFFQIPPKIWAIWAIWAQEIGILRHVVIFQHSRLRFDLIHRTKIFLDHLNDPLHIPHPLPQLCAPIVRDVLFACPDDMTTSFLAMTWLGLMRSCPKKIFTLRTS